MEEEDCEAVVVWLALIDCVAEPVTLGEPDSLEVWVMLGVPLVVIDGDPDELGVVVRLALIDCVAEPVGLSVLDSLGVAVTLALPLIDCPSIERLKSSTQYPVTSILERAAPRNELRRCISPFVSWEK